MTLKLKIKHHWNQILFILSFLLLAFYLIIGFLFLFSDTWIDFVPKGREIIGSSIAVFGCLRFYIAYRRFKTKHEKIYALRQAHKKLLEESHHVKAQ
jgi:hypothetical protein